MGHNLSDAVRWFRDCEHDNTRDFWQSNRERYVRDVRRPLVELLEAAGENTTEWRIYKPHRDTRFAPDAPPLKSFAGALHLGQNGTGRYVQVGTRGILASSGIPYLAPDQLAAWRSSVVGTPDLDAAITAARSAGCTIKSGYPEPLKRVPRGFDPEHPKAELLRWKGIEAFRRLGEVADLPVEWLVDTWNGGRCPVRVVGDRGRPERDGTVATLRPRVQILSTIEIEHPKAIAIS